MPSIDERVVRLELDSKSFDKNTQTAINNLNNLEKSLQFKDAGKGFEEIEKAAKKVDLSPMSEGIQKVSNQFNLLTTVADTAFRNIVNKAVDSGERIVKSLTIDQITTGWDRYAEKTGAVQTIMAATAQQFDDTQTQMEAVNSELEKLVWFTDETSFRFNDLVSSIGKFTANNIDLGESVKAMEGISTWAALSGANMNEASRAMYNLAQAISTGEVKLIDWKSIELANMGTAEFKQTVIETAEEMGTLVRVSDDLFTTLDGKGQVSMSNFSENLSKGWFTSDVLLKTLSRYGNFADRLNTLVDETGILTATAMNYIDDYVEGTLDMGEAMQATGLTADELTAWLEELGSSQNELGRRAFRAAQETKTFAEAIDYTKEALSSGWATSFTYIFGDYLEAKEWWSEIAEAMYDVFVVGGEIRNSVLEIWKAGGGREDFLDGIRELIVNLSDLLSVFKDAWNETFFGDEDFQLQNKANLLMSITRAFKDFAKAIKPTEATSRNLKDILKVIFNVLKTGIDTIKAITSGLSPLGKALNIIAGSILEVVGNLARFLNQGIANFFTPERLNKMSESLSYISRLISGGLLIGFKGLFDILKKVWDNFQMTTGGVKGIVEGLVITVKSLWGSFTEGGTIVNNVIDFLLNVIQGFVKVVTTAVGTITGLLTGEIKFEDIFGKNGDAGKSFSGLSDLLDNLNLDEKFEGVIDAIKNFGVWVEEFLKDLADADSQIRTTIADIGASIEFLFDKFKNLFEQMTVDDVKDIIFLIILWTFVNNLNTLNKSLSGAVKSVSGTVGTFNNILKDLTGQRTVLDKVTSMFTATKFLQIGVSCLLIVNGLAQLNNLDYKRTQESVAALGVTLALLLVALDRYSQISRVLQKQKKKYASDKSDFQTIGAQMLAISASAVLIAQAVGTIGRAFEDEMGNLDVTKLLASLGTTVIIVGLLGVLANAWIDATKTKGISEAPKISGLLISFSTSIVLIANSLEGLSNVKNPNALVKSAISLSLLIAALGGVAALLSGSEMNWRQSLAIVPTIIAFCLGLTELAITIGVLANIPLKNLSDSLIIFAGATIGMSAAIGVLGTVLKDTPAATIIAMGAAFELFALSILTLSGSLHVLEGIQWETIKTGVLTIGAMTAIFAALSGLIAFFDTKTFGMLSSSIETLAMSFLKFSAGVFVFSSAILSLSTSAAIFATIVGTIQLAAEKMGVDLPDIIEKGFDTVELIIREFLETLRNLTPDILLTVEALLGLIIIAIEANRHRTATAVVLTIIAIADAIEANGQEIVDAMVSLINFIKNAEDLFEALEDLAETLGEFASSAIIRFVGGAIKGVPGAILDLFGIEIGNAIDNHAGTLDVAMGDAIYAMNQSLNEEARKAAYEDAKAMIEGFDEGTVELSDEMYDAGKHAIDEYEKGVHDTAEINSPAKTTERDMEYMIDGYGEGIKNNSGRLYTYGAGIVDLMRGGELAELKATQHVVNTAVSGSTGEAVAESAKTIDEESDQIGDAAANAAKDSVDESKDAAAKELDAVKDEYVSMYQRLIDWAAANLDVSSLAEAIGFEPFNLLEGYGGKSYKGSSDDNSLAGQMMKDQEAAAEKQQKKGMPDYEKYLNDWYADVGANAGKAFDSGVGNGISSSGASTKAAKTKAENIADEFQKAIAKIDLTNKTASLQYELWEAMNPDADEAVKQQKKIESIMSDIEFQTQRTEAAQENYNKVLAEMGAEADETTEALHELYEAQIKLAELQNDLAEAQDKGTESAVDSGQAFRDATAQFAELTKGLDISSQLTRDIWNGVMMQHGLDQFVKTSETLVAAQENIGDMAVATATAISNSYGPELMATMNSVRPQMVDIGSNYMTDIATGITNNTPAVTTSITNLTTATTSQIGGEESVLVWTDLGRTLISSMDAGMQEQGLYLIENTLTLIRALLTNIMVELKIDALPGTSQVYFDVGMAIDNGMREGILAGMSSVINAAVRVARAALQAAKAELGINSPSKEGEWIGEMFDAGIALGIGEYSNKISDTASEVVKNITSNAFEDVKNSSIDLNDYMNDILDFDDKDFSVQVVVDADTTRAENTISDLERLQTSIGLTANKDMKIPENSRIFVKDGGIDDLAYSFNNLIMIETGIYEKVSQMVDSVDNYKTVRTTKAVTKEPSEEPKVVANFTQNNYSPKAISRVDTYRDTQRQLDMFTRHVDMKSKKIKQ